MGGFVLLAGSPPSLSCAEPDAVDRSLSAQLFPHHPLWRLLCSLPCARCQPGGCAPGQVSLARWHPTPPLPASCKINTNRGSQPEGPSLTTLLLLDVAFTRPHSSFMSPSSHAVSCRGSSETAFKMLKFFILFYLKQILGNNLLYRGSPRKAAKRGGRWARSDHQQLTMLKNVKSWQEIGLVSDVIGRRYNGTATKDS